MWYGYKRVPNLHKLRKLKLKKQNIRLRKYGWQSMFHNGYTKTQSMFYIPGIWNFLMLAPKQRIIAPQIVYIYNPTYFFILRVPNFVEDVSVSQSTNSLKFYHSISPYCYNMVLRLVQTSLNIFTKPFFKKIKFKGKGYYMYKNKRQTIAPQFGYAHRVYIYAQATSVKFLSKTKILLFGLSWTEISRTSHNVKKVKPINIFTGRGVRFARQLIYKKTGKVSSYR